LDANILLDTMDSTRKSSAYSERIILYCLKNRIGLFSSCDIISTIYYDEAKKSKPNALRKITDINSIVNIIEFANKEIAKACELMETKVYKDLEDTIQYVLAKKTNCDAIITNDRDFVAKDIPILSSREFVKKFVPDG